MSEFSIIAEYFSRHALPAGELGVGDDCAIVSPPIGQQLVICVDTLVAGRHFPTDTPAHAIGYKAVAVNLSDLAAMGATPHSILLALSLPSVDTGWLHDFSDGLYQACDDFGVRLIGGDTTKSPTLTMSITATGFVQAGKAIRRDGAKLGDVICVSGRLGSAAFALHHANSPLQSALDYPMPRVLLGQRLADFAHAMIDVSDGLLQDLGHILTASNVRGELYLERIPLADTLAALGFNTAMNYALAGGDDYELCFSLSEANLAKFTALYPDTPIYPIGRITATQNPTQKITQNPHENAPLICYHNGVPFFVHATGFNHFA